MGGRVMEGVVRSMNNLLERFHQSFFSYLLPETGRYVSIGLYMPPFGLIVAPILIKAIAMWIGYGVKCAEDEEKKEKEKKEKEEKRMKEELEKDDEDQEDEVKEEEAGDGDTEKKEDENKKNESEGDKKKKKTEWGAVMSLLPLCLMA